MPEPPTAVAVHRGPLPPGLADAAAAALAAAFAGDPTALAAGSGLRARHLLMRVPVDAAGAVGGLLVAPAVGLADGGDRVDGAAAWVPATAHGGGTARVLRSGSWRLLPRLGPRTLLGVVRDAAATDRIVSGYLQAHDAYLSVVGVRPEVRGRSLGSRLVRAVVEDARTAGLGRVVLVTHQPANVALYRALGFDLLDDTARSRGHALHVMARAT